MTIILFVLIIIGMFTFAFLKQKEIKVENNNNTDEIMDESIGRYDYIERVDVKHFFIDGVHTLVGEMPMPTPCDLLESKVLVMESYPEQIQIDFSVINNAESCIQQITPARFQVTATADEQASFKAKLMGRDIMLNIFEADIDERPEDFEIYLKG